METRKQEMEKAVVFFIEEDDETGEPYFMRGQLLPNGWVKNERGAIVPFTEEWKFAM